MGSEMCIRDSLDEVLSRDPIIGRDVRSARKRILNPPKKRPKTGLEKELEEANKKLEELKRILN